MKHAIMILAAASLWTGLKGQPLQAQVIAYEGDTLPEEDGWLRSDRLYPPARWLHDGWIYFRPDDNFGPNICEGESDYYRVELKRFIGSDRLFVEWRSITDGSGWRSGPIRFGMSNQAGMHFGADVARGEFRYSTPAGSATISYEMDVPHDFRLDLYEGHWFEWTLDGQPVVAGRPGGVFLRFRPFLVWGVAAGCTDDVSAIDYFRTGVPDEPDIPCEQITKFKAGCRDRRIRAKLKSGLQPGTELTLTNDGEHRTMRVKPNGKAKAKYRKQSGEHTLLLLNCPAISQEVVCEP